MTELHALLKWLIMILGLSIVMRPYLRIRNLKLWDRGFSLSFGLGSALSFFFCWIVSSFGIVSYDTPWVFISLIIVVCIGVLLTNFREVGRIISDNFKNDLCRYLLGFAVFALILCAGVWIKGFNPDITSTTEQYMDYGFIRAMYRQKTAVIEDIWFAGEPLNYYYLGQACTVFLCRLSGVSPEYGYPFMIYTVAAALFTTILSLSGAIIGGKKLGRIIGSLASSFMACFAGNGHYLYYGLFVPAYEAVTHDYSLRYAEYGYFYPDSTTYIGYNEAIEDHGKHEFPAYSFVLGDLHAHVINLLFVIPLLALLIDYAYEKRTEKPKTGLVNSVKSLFDARLVLIGVFFGIFMGSNYWDFPIYFIICGGVILFCDCHEYGIKWAVICDVLIKGLIMTGIGFICSYPFNRNFTKMASEILLATNHSLIYKLIILWIIPVGICLGFLIFLIRSKEISDRKIVPIMSALIPCSIGLIIMPEIIYVRDIYGEEYARFNTMFKFTYQAFVLTALVIGIAIGIWINCNKCLRGVILFCTVLLLSSYICVSTGQSMGNVFDPSKRLGSDCTDYINRNEHLYPQMNAINIINRDERTNIHILETGGTSYQPDDMISVFTGAPTYVGWGVHEWMWRNGWDPVGLRQGEVAYFYNSGDFDYCSQFIKDNKIDYIFVGPREIYNYDVNYSGFENLNGVEEVFRTEDGLYRLYKVL